MMQLGNVKMQNGIKNTGEGKHVNKYECWPYKIMIMLPYGIVNIGNIKTCRMQK